MVEVPAKFAELIAEQFKVQCSYVERGCKECIVFKVRCLKSRLFESFEHIFLCFISSIAFMVTVNKIIYFDANFQV
jgi:hypothetical protein